MLQRSMWLHNANALDAMRQAYREGVRRMVISGPTGSGKTHLAAGLIDTALEKGKRVAFVVSNLSLIDQTVDAFWREGINAVGVLQGRHEMSNPSQPVQVVSIQTAGKRFVFPQADVVLFDECHVLHKGHHHYMRMRPDAVFIGLSATPYTKGLGNVFQRLITTGTTQEMIDKGILCPFKVFATGHPDLSGIKLVAGDYHEGQLSERMQNVQLCADIVTTWQRLWGKDKTLVFAVDRAHAATITARYQEAGVKALYQDGDTPDDERTAIKRAFHSGDAQVVVNIGTLTTGTDWDVRCLQLCRPTRSEILYKQIIGRALRIAEGKDHALILDHSDTTQTLGFVTDIEYDFLDSREKPIVSADRKKALPKECHKCGALITKKLAKCWNCGQVFRVISDVYEDDGELIDVTPGGTERSGRRKYSSQDKAAWFAQIKRAQIDRGRQPGWAAHAFRDKFGVWPNAYKHVEPADFVSTEVAAFLKAKAIKYMTEKGLVGGRR